MTCEAWIDGKDTGVGLSLHSHYVLGDDRMIQFGANLATGIFRVA